MRIYPETRINLALCEGWISAPALAAKRGLATNGVNTSLGSLLRHGMLETRKVRVTHNSAGRTDVTEYRITDKGLDVLYPAFRSKTPEPATVQGEPTDDPFHWRTFVQPVPCQIYLRN